MLIDFSRFVSWASTSDLRRVDHAAVRALNDDRREGATPVYQNSKHRKNRGCPTQCPKVLIKPVQTNSNNYDVYEAKIRKDRNEVYRELLVGL